MLGLLIPSGYTLILLVTCCFCALRLPEGRGGIVLRSNASLMLLLYVECQMLMLFHLENPGDSKEHVQNGQMSPQCGHISIPSAPGSLLIGPTTPSAVSHFLTVPFYS